MINNPVWAECKMEFDAALTTMQELMCVAGKALKMNITRLAPLVLPVSEKLFYACNMLARKVRQHVAAWLASAHARIQSMSICTSLALFLHRDSTLSCSTAEGAAMH